MKPKYLTVAEAADFIGCTVSEAWQLAAEYRIYAYFYMPAKLGIAVSKQGYKHGGYAMLIPDDIHKISELTDEDQSIVVKHYNSSGKTISLYTPVSVTKKSVRFDRTMVDFSVYLDDLDYPELYALEEEKPTEENGSSERIERTHTKIIALLASRYAKRDKTCIKDSGVINGERLRDLILADAEKAKLDTVGLKSCGRIIRKILKYYRLEKIDTEIP